jgi:hypothetical protein
MTDLSLASVPDPRPDAVAVAVDDELVMLDLRHGEYLGLDDIARRIWELLDGRRTIAAVCEVLVVEYEVEPGRCQADVLDVVRQLTDADVVTVR